MVCTCMECTQGNYTIIELTEYAIIEVHMGS